MKPIVKYRYGINVNIVVYVGRRGGWAYIFCALYINIILSTAYSTVKCTYCTACTAIAIPDQVPGIIILYGMVLWNDGQCCTWSGIC